MTLYKEILIFRGWKVERKLIIFMQGAEQCISHNEKKNMETHDF